VVYKNDTPESLEADQIAITGAREHNLKNLSVSIPRGKFVVVTGVSGSGKSTLAFDIVFAEGQRRFLDAMSAYARQFVEQMARPDVDLITGLPPTVSIEQRNSRGGGKSTVATVTEIYHFIRLLFARLGMQHCPDCHVPVQGQTRDQLGAKLRAEMKRRGDLLLLAPVVRNRKGFHSDVALWAAKHGFQEIRADGVMYSTAEPFRLDRFREHDVEIVVGVLEKKSRSGTAPQQLIDRAIDLGHGVLFALSNDKEVTIHSTERSCPECGESFPPLDPKMFSYNSSQGWCPTCRGFGELFYLPEVERGARGDAIEESWFEWQEGKREQCPDCKGARLNRVARAVRLHWPVAAGARGPRSYEGGLKSEFPNIDFFARSSVEQALAFFRKIKLKGREAEIARDILPELVERLKFLCEVGLDYLQLGRGVTTLSGGEGQRIRLASQLGSNLSGVLYVLDEPTIGLHPRDNEHLLHALELLKNRGNTLLVVEHDEETMRRADFVIDLGPGAGVHGGKIVGAGTLDELLVNTSSTTGKSLRESKKYPARGARRPVTSKTAGLRLHRASANNLKNLTVDFPLNRFVAITGVSGSGKSTLVRECLLPSIKYALSRKKEGAPGCKITGFETLKAVYEVDQSPVGRTPRSTPATYVGFFDVIRQLFSQIPEARLRGYSTGRFSFNSAHGRCPECEGAGQVKLEMNFLPPAYITCESCGGTRFNRETLDIQFHGKNIAQVLELSVDEAIEFFAAVPRVRRPLEALRDTGLDYLKLGQISPTLSGGEAQRMKLVTHLLSGLKEQAELFDPRSKKNLFILEEPTIGLHMADVKRLVEVLQKLIEAGHSVIVIEHNLDLIAEADWVIDLGPEGGEAGGTMVARGTPEQIAQCKQSHTGRFLAPVLRKAKI
jgi:excinuclease ABC subunit A